VIFVLSGIGLLGSSLFGASGRRRSDALVLSGASGRTR